MNTPSLLSKKMPWWVKVCIVADCLPILALPALIALCPPVQGAATLIKFYPIAIVGGGVIAWLSWKERAEITWILLAIMLLTHIAMWILVNLS